VSGNVRERLVVRPVLGFDRVENVYSGSQRERWWIVGWRNEEFEGIDPRDSKVLGGELALANGEWPVAAIAEGQPVELFRVTSFPTFLRARGYPQK
jgi:hypothetical protein